VRASDEFTGGSDPFVNFMSEWLAQLAHSGRQSTAGIALAASSASQPVSLGSMARRIFVKAVDHATIWWRQSAKMAEGHGREGRCN
jgi:hypothetical protein